MKKYYCFACGGELIWNADFMRSELEPIENEDKDSVVNILTCPDCGAEVRVYQTPGGCPQMRRIPVGVKFAQGAALVYSTPQSSGADVRCIDPDFVLYPGERKLVHTGVYLDIPVGFEVQVRARSGLSLKYGVTVLNGVGTIDSDYQGECNVILVNHGDKPWSCKTGERIAQFVLAPVYQMGCFAIEEFSKKTVRGDGGFGHTGQ